MLERIRDFLTSRRFVIALTVLVGIVAAIYMLFITLIFDPFEEDLGDTASIVPRDVEYFVRWQGAGSNFKNFPEPTFWGSVKKSSVYKELEGSGGLAKLNEATGIGESVANLRAQVENVPATLSLTADLLREVAIAGKGEMGLGRKFDGILMLRVSFKVKAGLALLGFDFVRNKLPDDLGIVSEGDYYRLPAFFDGNDAYLGRQNDVMLLASSLEWLDKAADLKLKGGQDSLALASVFHDKVTAYLSENDEPVEIFMRWERLREHMPHWPPSGDDQGFPTRAAGAFFDTDMMRFAAGYFLPGERFQVRLEGDLDSTKAKSDFQRDWIEASPVSINRIKEFSGMVPHDSFFFASLAGRPDEVMTEMYGAMDSEIRRLMDEIASGTGNYNGMVDLLRTLGLHIQPGIFLSMRRNDYPEKTGDAKVEHDDTPVPAIALIAKESGASSYDDLLKMMQRDMRRLVEGGVRQWDLKLFGGASGKSFSSPAIPGTGEIILVHIPNNNAIVLCNHWDYATDIVKAAMASPLGTEADIKLLKRDGFRDALASVKNGAGLFLYLDPSEAWEWIDELAADVALGEFKDYMDQRYSNERPAITKRLGQELFGTDGRLSAADQRTLDDAVDEELLKLGQSEREGRVRELKINFLNDLLPLKWFDWLSIGLKTNRKSASTVLSGGLDLDG
ncbi:MAG: hypothetical protein H8E15_08455 [Planctomycetes bacterium]|nr:hypothetical protein [Planctomycetota bacterium]